MPRPEIVGFTRLAELTIQMYERYLPSAFTPDLSMLEKMNKIIEYMNQIGKLTADVVKQWNEVMEWLLNEGMEEAVVEQLNKWYEEGKFADLVLQILDELKEQGVSVRTYGAKGDGKTDDIEAFEKALASGYPVFIPHGEYRVSRGIKLPSNTVLTGAGKDNAVIKWLDSVGYGESLMYNENYTEGNHNIYVDGFTLDGNASRMGDPNAVGSGGSRDSGLTFRAVTNGTITRIKTVDTLLHGIDVTSSGLDYQYLGDGTIAPNPSSNILISECDTSGFGDDGITTHHSEYLQIVNNYSHDARRRGNCNGIEIDDGSRHVMLANNRTERNYGGVEIKAHANAPASRNVVVNGHMSREDVRSYNFRHIGHHTAEDPTSVSARSIVASNLSSINPNNTRGFQSGTAPRAVVVSAYVGVIINGITCIHERPELFTGSVIVVQYKARNVNINGVVLENFTQAEDGIYITGGSQRADNINISNVVANNSARRVISIGGSIQNVNVTNVAGINNGSIRDPLAIVVSINSNLDMMGISNDGYPSVADIAGDQYTTGLSLLHGGFRASSSSSGRIHEHGAVISSTSQSSASADKSAVIASSGGTAGTEYSAVIASLGSTTEGAEARNNAIIGSSNAKASGNRNTILASYNVSASGSYKVNGGYDGVRWELDSLGGNIRAGSTITGDNTWSDYGEYFESLNGKAIPTGTLVTLDMGKIRPAQEHDAIIGAVSETAGVILGASGFEWQDKFLKNEFGGYVMEYQEINTDYFDEETGQVIKGEPKLELMPVLNPAYDPEREYVPRETRPEWNIVGLVGQLYIRVDDTVIIGKGVTGKNGIGTLGETGIVMDITTPYDAEKGYGVAKVLLK